MAVDVLLGLQWGDEGKGKIVDFLASNYQMVARFQGGPNAGHTLNFDGQKFILHSIPSGIFREGLINLIGNGVVLDPVTLQKEIRDIEKMGVDYADRLLVSRKAHLILPTHRLLDAASEASKGKEKIGSTLRGIGPTYMDKTGRNGLRVGDITLPEFEKKYQVLRSKHLHLAQLYPQVEFDLEKEEAAWMESIELLRTLRMVDGEYFIQQFLREGKNVLAEGAQGSMLDIDFGTYPYVTSSNTVAAGACTGLGVSPRQIGEVIGVTKAYCTRVGGGPFPTELNDETGETLRREGAEFGATTGRPRRCGWIDLPQLRYTVMLNGVSQIALTKIDVLNHFESVKAATAYRYSGKITGQLPYDLCDIPVEPVMESFPGWNQSLEEASNYEQLPGAAKHFISAIENYLGVPVTMVSTGPDRKKLLLKEVSAAV